MTEDNALSEAPGIELKTANGDSLKCTSVPRVLGDVKASAELLRHNKGNAATGGIWRVRGTRGSAVLKVARAPSPESADAAWATSDDPTHWNYWRREAHAYESGLAARAYQDSAIAVPALLAANQRPDGGIELWLEDVAGPDGFGWSVARLARFARELGAGQARWAGRVPDTAWLSCGWLGQYLEHGPSSRVTVREELWDHPRVTVWPREVRMGLRRLWEERARALAAAEALERTLCHLDVWPANLIDAEGTSVLLDWSFVGDGAIGEDTANLVIDSCTDGLMDAALLPEIEQSAVEGYISGLRDGGWNGSADDVRTAVQICGAAKYSWFGPAVMSTAVRGTLSASNYNQDTSTEESMTRLAGLAALIARWALAALD